MSGRGQPPERVPTLTEVVERLPGAPDWQPAETHVTAPEAQAAPQVLGAASVPDPRASADPVAGPPVSLDPRPAQAAVFTAAHDEAVARRVIAELEAHIDRVLDARIRSALEPLLQALTSQVVADTRRELASTLRDGLARAWAQEAARHRSEPGPR